VGLCLCEFCNVWVCVCVGFDNCVGVLVTYVLVLTVFYCFFVFLYFFVYVHLFLFVFSVLVCGLLPPGENSVAVNNSNIYTITLGFKLASW